MIQRILPVAAALILCGCGTLAQTPLGPLKIGDTPAYATDASTRLVVERRDPHDSGRKILCSEPSPDISKALSAVIAAGASKPLPGGAVSAQLSAGESEAIVALAGRTAAVVALRDGLYRACEAYTNGLIGKDAYALVLANYGDLLVTLMLGEPASTTKSNEETTLQGLDVTKMQRAGPGGTQLPTAGDVPKGARPGKRSGSGGEQSDAVTADSGVLTQASSRNSETTGQPGGDKPSAPGSGEQGASAAVEVAKLYFASREDRSNRAVFVLCVAEAERAREEHRPFPDPASSGYIDKLCQGSLAAEQTRFQSPVNSGATAATGQLSGKKPSEY